MTFESYEESTPPPQFVTLDDHSSRVLFVDCEDGDKGHHLHVYYDMDAILVQYGPPAIENIEALKRIGDEHGLAFAQGVLYLLDLLRQSSDALRLEASLNRD